MLPGADVLRRAREIARAEGCDRWSSERPRPLGCWRPRLRRGGRRASVGMTHGHEAAWAQTPGSRQLLRRIGEGLDDVTYLGAYTRRRIASALSPAAGARMRQLAPGWTPTPSTRGGARTRPASGSGTGLATGRSWSASRG